RTGRLRLFETHEVSADVVLASACLPSLYHGIEIDGELYWDGGYSGNPAVFPLLHECRSHDVIVVLIHPLERPSLPKTAKAILNRVTELSFGAAFLREMRAIAFAKQTAERDPLAWGRLERRLRRARFSIIEAEELMSELSTESAVNTHHAFLDMLFEHGRERARLWIERNVRRFRPPVPVDLAQVFG
ncbi:MAG: patatin-like phospholipase family protein, partial [Gammaproteobacteria bacterium]|nr:patatin-like phospholipase family protein [Gammaproteobacteria bacterium]